MDEERFSFEDLEARPVECRLGRPSFGGFHGVKQEAVDFADQCLDVIDRIETDRKHFRLIEQLESAATSPALNTCPVK